MLRVQCINPIAYQGWDRLVTTQPDYSVFHSSAWACVLKEAYGYEPTYFAVIDEDRLSGLIAIMEIRSCFTGTRGVSLPFSDFCNPIISNQHIYKDLFDRIIAYAERKRWQYIEIRGGRQYLKPNLSSCRYIGHTLELGQGEDKIYSGLRDSTRRNVKKAQKKGVSVSVCHSFHSVKSYYKLHCLIRKHHGIPPQPFKFFKSVYKHIIAKEMGHVFLARHKNNVIAGAICFRFGGKAIYKYAASDRAYQQLRASNLVMWHAIQWYCRQRMTIFDFGRTETDNKGLDQFKRGWGALPKFFSYYKYSLDKHSFVKDPNDLTKYTRWLGGKIPLFILKPIGVLAYKHTG